METSLGRKKAKKRERKIFDEQISRFSAKSKNCRKMRTN
tara:strand:+ start:769 stop:885 length:117 start_codon:yes stop_codon:yes gene_type:complete